jgi:general secretion pathway protein A
VSSASAAHAQPAAARPKAAAPDAAPSKPLLLATQAEALRELGTLWGQQLPAEQPCQGAPKLNLRCYQGRGGLYELRLLDRPAIVALHDGQKLGYAVLSSMDADSATLSVNGQRQKVSLGALATRIDGEFTTLWKAPRAFREQVHPGDTGPDVDWIAGRLAELNKLDAPRTDQPLGDATRRLLLGFQAKQNLKADGVAGPRTYMRLNQLSGVDEPRLLLAAGMPATGTPAAGTGK